jgi:hypothetical protein
MQEKTEPRAVASGFRVGTQELTGMDRMNRMRDFRFEISNLRFLILPILSILVN